MKYDLTEEPWIPAYMLDGSLQQFGIRELLERATEIECVDGDNPLTPAAIQRLLVAIIRHAHEGPRNDVEWEGMWNVGHFGERVFEYLSDRADSFDLFHDENPFLQIGRMQVVDKPPSSVSKLVLNLSAGNNKLLFDHTRDGDVITISPAESARQLLVVLAFNPIGGQGSTISLGDGKKIKTPYGKAPVLSKAYCILLKGDNLFETLMMNLPTSPLSKGEVPSWEVGSPEMVGRSSKMRVPTILEGLTFMSKFAKLIPNGDRTVSKMYYTNGVQMDGRFIDPMVMYRKDKKDERFPFCPRRRRVGWTEGVGTMLRAAMEPEGANELPTTMRGLLSSEWVLDNSNKLWSSRIVAHGFLSDKSDINSWHEESLLLPLCVLQDVNLRKRALEAIEVAEHSYWELKSSAFESIAKRFVNGHKKMKPVEGKMTKPVKDLLQRNDPEIAYWDGMRVKYIEMLRSMSTGGDLEEISEEWKRGVSSMIIRAYDSFSTGLGDGIRAMFAIGDTKRMMWKIVRKIGGIDGKA